MSIFQRIKAPFTEAVDEPAAAVPQPRPVGELLREQREELGLDINDVGEVLRIKPAFLEALEENRPQDLPGPTYVLGFVRAYARHLGLDDERSWIVVAEGNEFDWPGYDIRKVGRSDRYDYGFLPPRFFNQVIEAFAAWHRTRKARLTSRE